MVELVWNPTDFLAFLEAEPSIGECEDHQYVVFQPPLRLELSVFQYGEGIYISVFCAPHEHAIVDIAMRQCPGARVVNDQRGNFIEFAAANCFTNRYDGESAIPYGVRLFVKPHIRVELFPG
jgi:hypothetical protein